MRLKKGDKAELPNGSPIIILGEYAAHDGQAYKFRFEDETKVRKLTARESYDIRDVTDDEDEG